MMTAAGWRPSSYLPVGLRPSLWLGLFFLILPAHAACCAIGTRRALRDSNPETPAHDRLLRVQAVLGLVEDDRGGPVHDLGGDFLAAMRGQAVHEKRLRLCL